MLLKDDHEEKRRKSIKRERRKVREKGGKEAPMQMENIYPLHLPNMTAGFQEKHCL